mgnify:FL=1
MTPIRLRAFGTGVLVLDPVAGQSMTNPPEEWRFLPHGFLQPAVDGEHVCLYCRYFNYHPTFLCLPICACHLHQGLVDNQKQSSVCCPEWTSRGRVGTKKGAPKHS